MVRLAAARDLKARRDRVMDTIVAALTALGRTSVIHTVRKGLPGRPARLEPLQDSSHAFASASSLNRRISTVRDLTMCLNIRMKVCWMKLGVQKAHRHSPTAAS